MRMRWRRTLTLDLILLSTLFVRNSFHRFLTYMYGYSYIDIRNDLYTVSLIVVTVIIKSVEEIFIAPRILITPVRG